tara:strand:- start:711 stop:965 length:255 start_codon:yes stop_codon:yes gene_type:complete
MTTMTQIDTTYNGWTNYETWNVSLYINNEYEMYKMARGWAEHGYKSLSHLLIETFGPKTPDGVKWNDDVLDIQELDEMLLELVD